MGKGSDAGRLRPQDGYDNSVVRFSGSDVAIKRKTNRSAKKSGLCLSIFHCYDVLPLNAMLPPAFASVVNGLTLTTNCFRSQHVSNTTSFLLRLLPRIACELSRFRSSSIVPN